MMEPALGPARPDPGVEIELWGREQLPSLRRFLPYKHGIPSHDTLNGVLATLDPVLFKACFASWVEGLRETEPDLVAINGKAARRTHARGKGLEPLHLVSAWASQQRLVLGQEAVSGKSNEITAIPLLLQRLALEGALVTIDAIAAQSAIAELILERGGDYLLALKANRPATFKDVEAFGACPPAGHGPERQGKFTRERRYYLSSTRLDAATFASAARRHWGIENCLHWVLDMVFKDDLSRLRTGHAPENMAVVRHMALNLLHRAKPTTSLKNRRKRAGWNTAYLESLIRQSA